MTIILFEGVDKTGKSTDAVRLSTEGDPFYSLIKQDYNSVKHLANDTSRVVTADRVDWITHLVYRLGMPDEEWHDPRVRTVFAAPEAHLVIKVHRDAREVEDELYPKGKLRSVNSTYWNLSEFLHFTGYDNGNPLFRSVSMIVVDAADVFEQRLVWMTTEKDGEKYFSDHLITPEGMRRMLQDIDKEYANV